MTESQRLPSSILRHVFVALLVFNGLFEFVAGSFMFFDMPGAMEMFAIEHTSQLDILGLVMGNGLFFVAGISALGVVWTLRGKAEGVVCGIAVGLFLVSFGLLGFLLFGQVSAIGVDGVRGGLNVLLGVLLLRGTRSKA
jgi:hypothetical protein